MCICKYIILVLILVENVFIGLKKGISKKMHWVAAKHTATFRKKKCTQTWKLGKKQVFRQFLIVFTFWIAQNCSDGYET